MKLKVLNRKEIVELLEAGNTLSYYTIYGKVYVENQNFLQLGAVRFNTFLKLRKELNMIKSDKQSWMCDAYIISK